MPVQPDRLHIRVLQLREGELRGVDCELKYLRIELERFQVEVINVGERIRSLERLLVSVPLLHPDACCTLDLGLVLAVQGMCWLTSPPNLLNLLRMCLL